MLLLKLDWLELDARRPPACIFGPSLFVILRWKSANRMNPAFRRPVPRPLGLPEQPTSTGTTESVKFRRATDENPRQGLKRSLRLQDHHASRGLWQVPDKVVVLSGMGALR